MMVCTYKNLNFLKFERLSDKHKNIYGILSKLTAYDSGEYIFYKYDNELYITYCKYLKCVTISLYFYELGKFGIIKETYSFFIKCIVDSLGIDVKNVYVG